MSATDDRKAVSATYEQIHLTITASNSPRDLRTIALALLEYSFSVASGAVTAGHTSDVRLFTKILPTKIPANKSA